MNDLAGFGAELSRLAYQHPDFVAQELARFGYKMTWFDHAGAQAFLAEGGAGAFLVFRGTEVTNWSWSDVWANLRVVLVRWPGEGQVHEGYGAEAGKLWERVRPKIRDLKIPYYLCGHSMGGVLATLTAQLIQLAEDVPHKPKGIFSYGSPKPGDSEFAKALKIPHFRYVNRADFAQSWPLNPCCVHAGPAIRVNSGGWPGPISDHKVERYIEAFRRLRGPGPATVD